jgi:choline dehydrogenase-like flavoprotein
MGLVDLREFEEEPRSIHTDLCIVGSGPAGASIAKEFAGSKIRVLVIEGGGAEQALANQALYDVENVGVARTTPQELVRNRILGGSSHTWTGRCVSFDDIDFECRTWVPSSGWPISPMEVLPFLERAGEYLGIGPNVYDDNLWKKLGIAPPQPLIDPTLLRSQFWQFSRDERNASEPTRFSRTIASIEEPNVKVLTYANVTHVNTSTDGTRVESLEIRTLEGKRFEVKAKIVVLACGGIENARLLLASNRIVLNGVGNANDLVGRFLMDHPRCTLGWFLPNRSAAIQDRFGHYWLDDEKGRHVYLHGLALGPAIQRKEQLLNCAAFLEDIPSADDPWMAMKRLLRTAKPDVETLEFNRAKPRSNEIITMIRHLPSLLNNAYRRVVKRRTPIIRAQDLVLVCLVEQAPDASSRVTLAERKDVLGMPISRIDWRIGELEWRSVLRLNELIGLELRRIGLPEHSHNVRLSEKIDWRSNFIDRAHPAGTTRMAISPKQGVVDQNCQVHGVAGLYIAGSSVFPTAGHGNPTLMIVALAIRLADWLKRNEFANT